MDVRFRGRPGGQGVGMKLSIASALLLATIVLTGCNNDEANPSSTDDAWAPPSDVPTELKDGATQPGATLEFGETATVPVTLDGTMSDEVTGTLEVTVDQEPTEASTEGLDSPMGEETPTQAWQLVVTVENVGDSDLGATSSPMGLTYADGDDHFTNTTSQGECVGYLPDTFAPGETAELCTTSWSEGDEPPVAVNLEDDGDYDDEPIYWRLP